MTRTDTLVVGTLVVLLALVAGLVGVPAIMPTAAPGSPTPSEPVAARPYREGVLGVATSVSPLTARSQADRDLVALVFSGLVRNGPGGTLVPDLAERWSTDASGKVWVFELRRDARWHDGEPVTAEDVAYTIRTLQDPAYRGPAASSWREVTVRATSMYTVTFTLATPLGGFLQAATQPLAPAHILGDVPVDLLADHPFGQAPVGTGPFALVSLDETSAVLAPASTVMPVDAPSADPSARPTDSLTTPAPTERPSRPLPYLPGLEFRFFDDPSALGAAYERGDLDVASGLPPASAVELATGPGSRLLRYPGATLTAVLFNLRPDHPTFRDAAVRTALFGAIDREALIAEAYSGAAAMASGPIPAASPWFDAAAEPAVKYDRSAAIKALRKAGWKDDDDGWRPKGAKKPLELEVLSPDEASSPAVHAAAARVVADWKRLGLAVKHTALPAAEFVGDHVRNGKYDVVVADLALGLDPDLYPLLASSQTLTGGSNVMGIQDPALDRLLAAARAPGSPEARTAAYKALQVQLGKGHYLLPLAFADEATVARNTLQGPVTRLVADPADRFWDVLTWRLADDR